MLRSWIVLLATLFVTVNSSDVDEYGFIQLLAHEEAINKHEVSAAEVKAAISNIGDGLKSITVPGKARQMAIDALMRSVSGSEKLDPETADTLNNISSLLTDILDQMLRERNEDQMQIDGILASLSACNNSGHPQDVFLEKAVADLRLNHTTCRHIEAELFNRDAQTCLALTEFLQHLSQPNCQKPEPTQAAIEGWNNMLHQGASWFTSTKTNYEPKRDECLASSHDLSERVDTCNKMQVTYENQFCQWHLHRTEMCGQMRTCYWQKIHEHQNLTGSIWPIANQRVREASIIVHVQCLIEKLLTEGNTDRDACIPTDAVKEEMQKYNNTYPPLPGEGYCDTGPVAMHPGKDGWYQYAYEHLDANTPAVTDTGIKCHEMTNNQTNDDFDDLNN